MSRLLPSTLVQQQSFNPDWIISNTPIPTGVVVSCQFTTVSDSAIYLSSLSVTDGVLSLVFTQGQQLCASVTTMGSGLVLPMDVHGTVTSASIEIGVIPSTNTVLNFTDAFVNSAYVNVVSDQNSKDSRLIITQDSERLEYALDGDLSLILDPRLDAVYDETTKTLTISMSDEDYMLFTQLGNDIITPDTMISMINGVRSKDGTIAVNIYNDGKLIPVELKADNWIELQNDGNISFCPDFVDVLDSYIAPTTHIGYYPLDDAYDKDNKRDTGLLLLTDAYGGFNGGERVDLVEEDRNIDMVSEVDTQ